MYCAGVLRLSYLDTNHEVTEVDASLGKSEAGGSEGGSHDAAIILDNGDPDLYDALGILVETNSGRESLGEDET